MSFENWFESTGVWDKGISEKNEKLCLFISIEWEKVLD